MIALIGALCAMLVFAGGYVATTDLLSGLLLTSFGVIGLGTLFAAMQSAAQPNHRLDTRDGMTLRQLYDFLGGAVALTGDTRIFVGDSGLNPVGAAFVCILDGHRTVVLERRLEPNESTVAIYHDLF